MAYRILADENPERATVDYPRKLDHGVERLDGVTELGLGAEDDAIARYAREHDRLTLTQEDDFFTELEAGDIVHEMTQYLEQSDIILEYVSRNWL